MNAWNIPIPTVASGYIPIRHLALCDAFRFAILTLNQTLNLEQAKLWLLTAHACWWMDEFPEVAESSLDYIEVVRKNIAVNLLTVENVSFERQFKGKDATTRAATLSCFNLARS